MKIYEKHIYATNDISVISYIYVSVEQMQPLSNPKEHHVNDLRVLKELKVVISRIKIEP